MPPTDVTASIIATLKDTCGNLIQLNPNWHAIDASNEEDDESRALHTESGPRSADTKGLGEKTAGAKNEEKWTLILVRELRHSPEKSLAALTIRRICGSWTP